jgi:hypothetical protein
MCIGLLNVRVPSTQAARAVTGRSIGPLCPDRKGHLDLIEKRLHMPVNRCEPENRRSHLPPFPQPRRTRYLYPPF